MDADAVVVGSGAWRCVAAALAAAGRSVVVLEAGPFVDEGSMPTDELAHGRLYLNYGLLATWDSSLTMLAGSAVGGGTLVNWMTSLPAPSGSARTGATTIRRADRRRVGRRRRGDRVRDRSPSPP